MRTFRTLTIAAAFIAAVFTQGKAYAETIGGGSIRVTAAEPGAQIKIRYVTEQGTVEKSIAGTEVLHLSSFTIDDQGGPFPLLSPASNQFNLYKGETTDFIIMGGSNDLVRLSFEQAGIQEELQLDFQWTPKLQILTSAADKVEVLDESDQLLHDVGEEALFLTSGNGMAIRFVVPDAGQQGSNDSGNDQGPGDNLAPSGEASGGCSMASGSAGNFGSGLCLLLPGALAVGRRIRRK
jgi:hypothetical protein